MSARLKLKRMQSQIKGFQKQAEIAEYDRDRIIELFMKNTERYVVESSVDAEVVPLKSIPEKGKIDKEWWNSHAI